MNILVNLKKLFPFHCGRKQKPSPVVDYDFNLIGRYFYHAPEDESGNFFEITDDTAEDMDLDKVFSKIDRTKSCIGRQYLYSKIRRIDYRPEELFSFDGKVGFFNENIRVREVTSGILAKLDGSEGYFFQELFQGERPEPANLLAAYILSGMFVVFLVLSLAVNQFFFFPLALTFACNTFLYLRNKKKLYTYLWNTGELKKNLRAAALLIKEPGIRKNFMPESDFLTELKKLERKSNLILTEKNQSNDIIAVFSYFIDLVYIALNLEVIFFSSYIREADRNRENLSVLFTFLGETDAAASISGLFDMGEVCRPRFTDDKHVKVEEIIHPLVGNCVKNSLELKDRSLLLTGSNMSGKTTFIRAFAINSLLAQTVNCCFAKTFIAPRLNIYTSIRIADSVEDGSSYFFREMLIIKEFLANRDLDRRCLFILDEIFKGTNTLERISAGYSVLSYLNNSDHFVFASTHDTELAGLLSGEGYDLYHFCEQVGEEGLVFDYKLKKGKLTTRNAIKILKLYDFPEEVIEKALRTQEELSV